MIRNYYLYNFSSKPQQLVSIPNLKPFTNDLERIGRSSIRSQHEGISSEMNTTSPQLVWLDAAGPNRCSHLIRCHKSQPWREDSESIAHKRQANHSLSTNSISLLSTIPSLSPRHSSSLSSFPIYSALLYSTHSPNCQPKLPLSPPLFIELVPSSSSAIPQAHQLLPQVDPVGAIECPSPLPSHAMH